MSVFDMAFDGALASALATIVSNPFDVMRTRFQLQGELQKAGQYHVLYNHLAQGMYRVAREEGARALQKGFTSAVLWQITQNSIRIGLYPAVKGEIGHMTGHPDNVGVAIGAAAVCGVCGSLAASPFLMVKTRLQAQRNTMVSLHGRQLSTASVGEQYTYKGVWDALSSIFREGGVRGLWYGCAIAAQRTMMGSIAQLVSYDIGKKYACHYLGLKPSDITVHVIAAFFASFSITLFMTPLDVVMTRSYNHRQGTPGTYSSNIAVATYQIYRVEGLRGMYKGAAALFNRTLPHTVATFVALEGIRKFREGHTSRAYTAGSTFNKAGPLRNRTGDASQMTSTAPAATTR